MKRIALCICVISSSSFAQEPSPSVMPFTLDVQRVAPGFTKNEAEELRNELPRLLRVANLNIPLAMAQQSALVALKRQDCDRDDGCLQQLAQKAQTLYAMHASVDFTLEKNVVVTGRVVSDEGVLVRRLQTVTLPKGKAPFMTVAREGLTKLIADLELTKLPTSRAVVPPPVVVVQPLDAPVVVKPQIEALPPPAIEASLGTRRTVGYVTAGAGIAAIIVGGLVYFLAPRVAFDENGNVVRGYEAQVDPTRRQQGAGLAVLGVGLAAVVVGGVLWGLEPATQPTVSIAPIAGGASCVVGGTFR
jgi:hypothetical protein